ncbi:2-oxo acid dehydrogenase subunit E2 [Candidatus Fukatsuia symbiotica]|uniref:2-oxo acid dehydrogenase subunit E2 n=1 Tax=Candidatus Fukatsuia TaxID=1927833 RepID=UPI0009325795|nr:2-oxo acid dehydrogenase subunit E2 [Candidatus Fukatsuia symbiotica]MEA9445971.1 2-oxo acid dehydrogenase subunit E2 [Candidatus Fukatsuia symbiotica]
MSIEIKVPDIGADEVEVTEIMVKIGDPVEIEQSLLTVEGDKASMEIPSPHAGIIKEIKVALGDKIETGKLIMICERGTDSDTASANEEEKPAVEPPSTPIAIDKNNINNNNTDSSKIDNSSVSSSKTESTNEFTENSSYAHATPLIRRLAREFGINLAKVTATGRKGRILREDLQTYVKNLVKHTSEGGMSDIGILPWPKVDFSKFGDIEEIELGRIQKISGANLSRNWIMIPHVTQFDETDITELEAFRKQQNIESEKKKWDVKITPLVFLMKAAAQALETYPRFNSSLSSDAQKLTLKKYINIGVAVDTANGLVVPVFRDVNKKGVIELSRELALISKKARDGKLTAADMQGGCFTISSLGGIGGTAFTPIVNAPEVAILGVSKSSMKPIWNGKEFVPRLMLPLSLSFDHRVIDGAAGARFVSHIGCLMADIRRLIM